MGIRSRREVEASLAPEPVRDGCKLRKGQSVRFTNEAGATFGPYKITGFDDGSHPCFKWGRHVYTDDEAYWFPSKESELELVK